jgi:uncharacterized membrane protein
VSQLRVSLEPLGPWAATRALSVLRVLPAGLIAVAMAAIWAVGFGFLAVQRHLAGGSHAEDLGFTDQVLSNFLRGQWFRMSIYQGATWNTEIEVSRLARPDSLLAFHVEPMLLLLVPIYAICGGIVALLVLQAAALAAGAIPAYRLGRHATGSNAAGVAVAAAYLLSPLGQWAVLADFHTSTLAAPLLLLSMERLIVKGAPRQALIVSAVALTAREDAGPVVAMLGVALVLLARSRAKTGFELIGMGTAWTIVCLGVIRGYSGSTSPFDVRYGATLGAGAEPSLAALVRPEVVGYGATLVLSGGWLGLLAPLALLPGLPSLALNALSTSPWMATGKAHYSGLVLPFIALGAAAGLRRLRHNPHALHLAALGLVLTSLAAYVREGAGPLGANYAPASITPHATEAAALAAWLPPEAPVSASSALVPHVSRRAGVYVFPAVLDAEYVFVDLRASPAPTSAGDVFTRLRTMLAQGGWRIEHAEDGLLLLRRALDAPAIDVDGLPTVLADSSNGESDRAGQSYANVSLLSAALLPSPDGAIDVDGPHWILRTTWRAERPLPPGTRLEFWIDRADGQRQHVWDLADLWWNPPRRWAPGAAVTVDVPDVPVRQFRAWQATWSDDDG